MVHEPPFESVPQPPPSGPMMAYATPEAPARPTSVFVISLIGIIYAGLGLLSGLMGVVSVIFIMVLMRQQQNATATPFAGFAPGWNIAFSVVGLSLAGLLMFASIAAMRMREAGRVWMLRWAWVYIAWQVFTLAVQALVILPAALAGAGATPGAAGLPATMKAIMYAGPVFSLVVTIVYPAFVLAFMNRSDVRFAYERAIEHGLTGGRVTFAGGQQQQPAPGQYPAS